MQFARRSATLLRRATATKTENTSANYPDNYLARQEKIEEALVNLKSARENLASISGEIVLFNVNYVISYCFLAN